MRVVPPRTLWPSVFAVVLLAAVAPACGDDDGEGLAPVVVTAAGDVEGAVAEYRALLGDDNGGTPGSAEGGRREINWDAVPDELASPNALPGDFFNDTAEPRARGAEFTTPGEHVTVSADSDNPDGAAPRFADINPTYADEFVVFSEERLFSPIGSNEVLLTFFVPGTDSPAVVRGFGAVYTGVDEVENTAFEYFDIDGNSLGTYDTPVSEGGLSFLGVVFGEAVVHQVMIRYGTDALGPDEDDGTDVAVMDDFIYGEPQPAP
jgi:hypothetical protein